LAAQPVPVYVAFPMTPATSATPPAPIKTPCIKVCVVDGESGLCLGCFRKLGEVARWSGLSDAEREAIMAELPARRSLIRPEKLGLP
jgi:uncharacterized protein